MVMRPCIVLQGIKRTVDSCGQGHLMYNLPNHRVKMDLEGGKEALS